MVAVQGIGVSEQQAQRFRDTSQLSEAVGAAVRKVIREEAEELHEELVGRRDGA